ncbi:MAG TPA: glycosyltransferase family 2 protein [Candidatus Saccharimonadales bacterium]|nr:glycosyltransferase family 2 protein [Candidatus Saccharimonadales bacterium]
MTFTCIIPFFNEGERIIKVLDAVVKIKGIDEIICADDGSTDGTAGIIQQQYPQVVIVKNKKNLGKTEAVKTALQQSKREYILLLDADLQNLHHTMLEKAIATFKRDKKIDMLILRRTKTPFGVKFPFYDVLLCGQRILKKDDLLKALSIYRPKGYELELALNQYMLEKHKKVCIMPLSFTNTGSMKKVGLIPGVYKIFHMSFGLAFGYIGLSNIIKQLLFFSMKDCQGELSTTDIK